MIASRTRAMTLLCAAFAIGLIVGVGGLTLAARAGKANWVWRGRASGRQSQGYGANLDRKLDFKLAPSTRDSISAVWCRGQVAMDSIRQTLRLPMDSLFQLIRPAVDMRREQSRSELRAFLSAPQRQRYDSMVRADDEQRKKMRDQGGPPATGGPCTGTPGGPGPRGGFDRG